MPPDAISIIYVLISVLLLTVFYNLIFALGIGIILASLLYAKRIADDTNVKVTHYNHIDYTPYEERVEKESHYQIRILHIDGQFFFGSITQIVSHFDEMLETKYIILNYKLFYYRCQAFDNLCRLTQYRLYTF